MDAMRSLRLLFFVGLLLLSSLTFAAKWAFVVAGDGRADPNAKPPRVEDVDGVNTLITGEIAQAVLKEHAKFLLWTGDLVLGSRDAATFEKQLRHWRDVMEPVYKARVPVLAVRGNHESNSKDCSTAWNRVFEGKYAMPKNGPTEETNLTFYRDQGPVLVVGVDQYTAGKEVVNQPWLDETLRRHSKPFVFVFGHEMAFMAGNHTDTLDVDPAKRDAFWQSLVHAGARVYFAGHDHFYDHMVVTGNGSEIHQFVAGTAGAPFYKHGDYTGRNGDWHVERAKHLDQTYGYILVEIDGKRATVTFKGRTAPGVYEPMDSFSYMVP
jgi:hypothetical protein